VPLQLLLLLLMIPEYGITPVDDGTIVARSSSIKIHHLVICVIPGLSWYHVSLL
jgi:hypothetical protein